MAIDRGRARQCLKAFDFRKLFIEELGWDRFSRTIVKEIDGQEYRFHGVAEKRGVVVLVADSIPEYAIRVKLDKLIAKDHFEHLIVFADQAHGRQKWQWVRKESGKPTAVRNYDYSASGHAGELLLQKLDSLVFTLDEEEAGIHTGTVTGRLRTFDVEKVTKKFYERFKTEHSGFLGFIKGIPDKQMESWYASVMINRLMFLYFIQEKGFLNGDKDYLRNKLTESGDRKRDAYYAEFLCPLFFQGFARKKADRSTATNKLLGEIPYLNGGLFQKHQIEELHGKTIHIADAAFEKLFAFFKEYNWHLDERENRDDSEINPDVLGYIFEKYINQKQMGAYYTKEDITEYISQNTIIPFLLDEARKGCAIAFAPEGSVWRLLREDPDRYIHDAMKKGANLALPAEIEAGINDVAQRAGWNRTAPEEYALSTEIWREAIDRHQRYRTVRAKLSGGEVHEVNDLVTLNLNIRQFAQDVIQFSEGPELLRAIWKAIEKVTVLDPTCGSGAFLFAALNILKPLYDACLQRMEGFVEDLEAVGKHDPKKFKDFRDTLSKSKEHPKQDYFVLKAIIVNNLFGVDIMEEAVEICKLRLFLKLVAQVESQDRIEPLPDIDFNIRAGNTLVGYATLKDIGPTRGIRTDEENEMLGAIEDKALLLDAKVRSFRLQQTELDGTVTPDDKAILRTQFDELDRELNEYLSGEYGVKKSDVRKWTLSHKPFHWFCDFHEIVSAGGFDVIIGNPPYVVFPSEKVTYGFPIGSFTTESAKNLYALTWERALALLAPNGHAGLIVQLTIMSSERMKVLQDLLIGRGNLTCISFPRRPESVFDGVEMPVAIIQVSASRNPPKFATSRISRFYSEERPNALNVLALASHSKRSHGFRIAKLGNPIQLRIFDKLENLSLQNLGAFVSKQSEHRVYYQEACRYWVKSCLGLPRFRKNGVESEPPHGRTLSFQSREHAGLATCILNSSIFYWLYSVLSDCEHVNDDFVRRFPVPSNALDGRWWERADFLTRAIQSSSKQKTIQTKQGYTIEYDEINAAKERLHIEVIDRILGKGFGLTDEEIDFVINYDIKYRMSTDANEE
jgi:hypothetical protein